MNPRLRSMTVSAETTMLILDRFTPGLDRDQMALLFGAIHDAARAANLGGVLVFPFAVDLPDDEPDPGDAATWSPMDVPPAVRDAIRTSLVLLGLVARQFDSDDYRSKAAVLADYLGDDETVTREQAKAAGS